MKRVRSRAGPDLISLTACNEERNAFRVSGVVNRFTKMCDIDEISGDGSRRRMCRESAKW